MLSLRYIRENVELVKEACKAKNEPDRIDRIIELDVQRRDIIQEVEVLKSKRNDISKDIGKLMKSDPEKAAQFRDEAGELSSRVKEMDQALSQIEGELDELLLFVPNMPHSSVPRGSAKDNQVIRVEGEAVKPDFMVKDHLTIMSELDILDMGRASKMTGSFFPLFKGKGAKFVRALLQFMLDLHTEVHGFTELALPFLANANSMKNTGQLPKLKDDMYYVGEDKFYLIPTAEVVLTNYRAGEMLKEEELPVKYCGYTPCFRREAGAYGADTKGLQRLHQFDKVELVLLAHPEKSYEMHEKLLFWSEEVLRRLGLTYRILLLASGDLSFSAAKCYDIELWAPADEKWLEVSSCSNFEDFQARRSDIRYRPMNGGKPQYVHTLNSSGVALPRLIIAIMENYQQADGKIRIPDALIPYFGGEFID